MLFLTSLAPLVPIFLLHANLVLAAPEAGCLSFSLNSTSSTGNLSSLSYVSSAISAGIVCESSNAKNADGTCPLDVEGVFNTSSTVEFDSSMDGISFSDNDTDVLRQTVGTAVNELTNSTYILGVPHQTVNVSQGFTGHARWLGKQTCYQGFVSNCRSNFLASNQSLTMCFPQVVTGEMAEGHPMPVGSVNLFTTSASDADALKNDPAEVGAAPTLIVSSKIVVGIVGLAAILLL